MPAARGYGNVSVMPLQAGIHIRCKNMSKKAKPAAKKPAAAKAPKYTFFVKKAVQDFARDAGMMVGSDAYDAFNLSIHNMLAEAAKRCTENKRKTLKAYDF